MQVTMTTIRIKPSCLHGTKNLEFGQTKLKVTWMGSFIVQDPGVPMDRRHIRGYITTVKLVELILY